jgi:hypothetical protein
MFPYSQVFEILQGQALRLEFCLRNLLNYLPHLLGDKIKSAKNHYTREVIVKLSYFRRYLIY